MQNVVEQQLLQPNPGAGSKSGAAPEELAVRGGPPAVRAPKPASYLHGPQEIGEEEIRAVTAALRRKNLFRFFKDEADSPTAQFEKLFATMTGARQVLAVNSGTSALICGLVGLGVSSGDEVLVPAYTYIATAAAVLAVRAIPVIVEIDGSLGMDPVDAARKITPRTKAMLPVHMRGVPCRMDELMALAQQRSLKVLEDCAQANGGSYHGRALGTLGDAGAFSLQHFKVITAGEGGVVVTHDPVIFQRAACYHDSAYSFWQERHWNIEPFLGENYRMSELNGALALAQLKKRDRILTRLRTIKRRLLETVRELPGLTLQNVPDPDGDCGLALIFFVETADRARRFAEALQAEGMTAGSIFDKTIPDRHIFYHWDYVMHKRTPDAYGYPWKDPTRPCQVDYSREMCPQTVGWLERAVVLPLTQTMTDAHVEDCAKAIAKVARGL